MINNLPTIYEVVTGITKQQSKEKNPNGSSKSNKYNSSKKSGGLAERQKSPDLPPYKENNDIREDEEEDAEHDNTLCGACGDSYSNDEFWICCDLCEKWFHGECVRITPARAQHIKQWKCPGCSSKKARA